MGGPFHASIPPGHVRRLHASGRHGFARLGRRGLPGRTVQRARSRRLASHGLRRRRRRRPSGTTLGRRTGSHQRSARRFRARTRLAGPSREELRLGHLHPRRLAGRRQTVAGSLPGEPQRRRRGEPARRRGRHEQRAGKAGRVESFQADGRRRHGRAGDQRPRGVEDLGLERGRRLYRLPVGGRRRRAVRIQEHRADGPRFSTVVQRQGPGRLDRRHQGLHGRGWHDRFAARGFRQAVHRRGVFGL